MIDRFYRFLLESWNFSALYAGLMGLWIFSWSGPISGYLHSHVNTICIRRHGLCMATSHGRILPLSHIIVGGKKWRPLILFPLLPGGQCSSRLKLFEKTNKQHEIGCSYYVFYTYIWNTLRLQISGRQISGRFQTYKKYLTSNTHS